MLATRLGRALVLAWCAGLSSTAWAQAAPHSGAAESTAAPAPALPPSKNLAPGFAGLRAEDKVVLVPIDVELFELGAGGVPEPKAEWTAAALDHMKAALAQARGRFRLALLEISEREADDFAEQLGLQAAVARAIAQHHAQPGAATLPTKAGQLLWTLGDAMQPLAAKTGARYGLFLWVRDYYASAQRKAMVVGMALLGVYMAGGAQVGHASLVDLQTGQVVWFNLLSRGHGDLREAKPAQESMDALLANFPVQP